MNKGYVVVLIMLLGIIITGCSPVTTVTMDENGKGTLSYKMDIKKNAIEETGFTVAKNIDEFAKLLESKMEKTLDIKVSVDKTSSNEVDYIIFTMTYNSIEEYNKKIGEVDDQIEQLWDPNSFEEGIMGSSFKMNDNYLLELEALQEYMTDNGITVDINNRNCRKFLKIIKEYLQVDYDLVEDSEEEKKIITKDENEENNIHVKIIEDENGKKLFIDNKAYVGLEIYIERFLEFYSEEIFNVEYLNKNTQDITDTDNKEILKRTFVKFELATKVKEIIDAKKGKKSDEYTINDLTPVMAVKLFNDQVAQEFTELYSAEYVKYKNDKEKYVENVDFSYDDMMTMYYEKKTQYELVFGDNKLTFTDENLYDFLDDDNYIELSSKLDSRHGGSTRGGIANTEDTDMITSNKDNVNNSIVNNTDLDENNTAYTSSKQKNNNETISGKEGNNIISDLFDDTPFTGDSFSMLLVSSVAIISLGGLLAILYKHKTSNS